MKKTNKKTHRAQLKALTRIRGIEREIHFENGGTLSDWKGGYHTITVDKKKDHSRKACRTNQWRL